LLEISFEKENLRIQRRFAVCYLAMLLADLEKLPVYLKPELGAGTVS
jgi:hypothetical protein